MSAAARQLPGGPLINADRFRSIHQAEWERLDALITRMEKRSVRALGDEDLLALPGLYRTTLSSLSVARDTSLDRSLIIYLEQLCTRAYFQIYGVQAPVRRQLASFFAHAWPTAVRGLWRETLVSAVLMLLAATAAFLLVRSAPEWFYAIIAGDLASGRDPSASQEHLRATLYDSGDGMLVTFATYLFTHNSQVAIFAFALGFAFAVPTVLLILYNGLSLGAMFAVFQTQGLGINFTAWLMIHGTTELFAVAVAGAAGIRIGMAVAFPGRVMRMESAVLAGRQAGTAMAGVVLMLLVAGILEGIGRQTVTGDVARFIIGTAMLTGWIIYFYLWGGRRA
ncbi:stage II sporulation protein M [Altericroceibacterium xinjiangense]|uniref:stage II sporulation protein M n=1 Tax=Altericroceibacterium xinjiangense TaxID=762261 RepID=UPI001F49F10E|nr:stage II sporulation protein M [Altericroceibacterium xinjiangense]